MSVRQSSSTGSSCPLEGSREEACPVKRRELQLTTTEMYDYQNQFYTANVGPCC